MAFEFKKLSDVNSIEAMKDGLNVLVEDGDEIVKLAANSMIPEDVALKSDIPEDIALKSDIPDAIPVPATAEVGQVIAVKAVDENGKPTEWEAVAVGGGSGSFVVEYYAANNRLYKDENLTQEIDVFEDVWQENLFNGKMSAIIDTSGEWYWRLVTGVEGTGYRSFVVECGNKVFYTNGYDGSDAVPS